MTLHYGYARLCFHMTPLRLLRRPVPKPFLHTHREIKENRHKCDPLSPVAWRRRGLSEGGLQCVPAANHNVWDLVLVLILHSHLHNRKWKHDMKTNAFVRYGPVGPDEPRGTSLMNAASKEQVSTLTRSMMDHSILQKPHHSLLRMHYLVPEPNPQLVNVPKISESQVLQVRHPVHDHRSRGMLVVFAICFAGIEFRQHVQASRRGESCTLTCNPRIWSYRRSSAHGTWALLPAHTRNTGKTHANVEQPKSKNIAKVNSSQGFLLLLFLLGPQTLVILIS